VDQGIEHSGGASFAKNPDISTAATSSSWPSKAAATPWLHVRRARPVHASTPQNSVIVKMKSQRTAHVPNRFDQVPLRAPCSRLTTSALPQLAAPSISAPIKSTRQIVEISQAFAHAHQLGMATVLWCYLRTTPSRRTRTITSPPTSRPGQSSGRDHRGRYHQQKLPENNGGYQALKWRFQLRQIDKRIYNDLPATTPIDLTRYQVANCYMGRAASSTAVRLRRQ